MYLITGGAGYIGSHMAYKLLDSGFDVLIFDNLETGHAEIIEKMKTAYNNLVFIKGDLRNKDDIDKVFQNHKIDAVVHFAAYALVGESVQNPKKYWINNVAGSLNLLNSMVENNADKIVFSSTCATYGEPKYIPIDEKHPQSPINPYGQTKLAVEKIMDDYDKAYNLRSVRLRYFNVAGADKLARTGEWHDMETHLIPNIIKSVITKGKPLEIYGNDYDTKDGTCIRDYIDMEDLIDAHIKALNYLESGGRTNFFNLGTNEGSSVTDVCLQTKEVTGKEIKYKIMQRREGDPSALIGDNKKIKEVLGWTPKHTLKESIQNAYNWELKRISEFKLN